MLRKCHFRVTVVLIYFFTILQDVGLLATEPEHSMSNLVFEIPNTFLSEITYEPKSVREMVDFETLTLCIQIQIKCVFIFARSQVKIFGEGKGW